ncbi:hypothetical protein HKX48_006254 [Thoreauomyces humboldtii]|nr:hypothetical protein HKX48_006254 [Thoreauomyces humboldtii]
MGLGNKEAHAVTKVADLSETAIPIIDLSGIASSPPDPDALTHVASQIRSACLNTGFFAVTRHGIDPALIERVFSKSKALFDAPKEVKSRYRNSTQMAGYFGIGDVSKSAWNGYGQENLDPDNQRTGDFKEGFDMSRELPADDPNRGKPFRKENNWPDEDLFPEMKATMLEYVSEVNRLGMTLLTAFEKAMDVVGGNPDLSMPSSEETLSQHFDEPMTMLRTLRYHPSRGPVDLGHLGCGAHTDYGCMAILAQDSPGLQLFDQFNSQWCRVPHIPGALIINIGDMTSRWTNGEFKSTIHRVVNVVDDSQADVGNGGGLRHSIVYFFEPGFDTVVEVLEPFRKKGEPVKFPPLKMGDHLKNMYSASWKEESSAT